MLVRIDKLLPAGTFVELFMLSGLFPPQRTVKHSKKAKTKFFDFIAQGMIDNIDSGKCLTQLHTMQN